MLAVKEPIIDLENDRLRPVADISEKITGHRISPQGIWRIRTKGARGVTLECYFVNGCWQTTEAAFAAFIRGQTKAAVEASTAAGDPAERDPVKTKRLKAAGLI